MNSIRHYSLDSKHAQSVLSIIKNMRTPSSTDELEESYKTSFGMTFIDHVVIDEAMNLGVPFSFAHEQDGAIVQNIFPIRKFADEQISSSSNAELHLHTEVAFHDSRPDILLLFCVRADEEAGTTFAELHEILRCIPRWAIEQLQQPEFAFHPDLSFTMNGASFEPLIQPVFSTDLAEMTYDYTAIEPITSHAGVALDFLNRAIAHCKKTIYLRQGEFLAIPNRRTVHGRTNYTPRFDGQDRWLKRVIAARPERCLDNRDICLNQSPMRI